ncbi:unnamed protein product [Linum tenue]|uniref:Transmembrane protein n=1 Tax=Linum tenue TaxID=586396 RepID=A0AAV0Q7F8_9ROSI|nr:unnamed protein product [Linum tenue]
MLKKNTSSSSVGTFAVLCIIVIVAASSLDFVAAQPSSKCQIMCTGNASWSNNDNDGTVRIDPLDKLKKYRGGFDITSKNYWSSTAFTGIYGYAIAALCLLAGICYGIFKLVIVLCCKNRRRKLKGGSKSSPPNDERYVMYKRLVILVLLTLVAIMVASGVALGGSSSFHNRAKKAVDIIIHTANNASRTIYDVTSAMTGISRTLESTEASSQFPAAMTASRFLSSTSRRLDREAASIEKEARDNRRRIDIAVTIVYVISVVAIALNLAVTIALSVCGVLRIRKAINWLFALCWSLIVLCWLLFGIYYFLHNFANDTCRALETFDHNPQNSSLSSLVPCDDLAAAKPTLRRVREGIYDLVSQLNVAATNVSSTLGVPPNFIQVCNPFSSPPNYHYQPHDDFSCPPPSIPIRDIPKVVKLVTCSDDGTCSNGQFVSPADYRLVEGYASSIQSLVDAFPEIQSLVECESVRASLSRIVDRHCQPLKKNAKIAWASLIPLSVLNMALLVLVLVIQRIGPLGTSGSVGAVAKDDMAPLPRHSSSLELAGSGGHRRLV